MTALLMASRARVSSDAPAYSAGYSIAPTPTMQPWPGISLGTECTVPMVPGLVMVAVVPPKSSTASLPTRARRTMSSYEVQNSRKSMPSAALMFGTRSCRAPSAVCTSMARPRLTCSGRAMAGLPPSSV